MINRLSLIWVAVKLLSHWLFDWFLTVFSFQVSQILFSRPLKSTLVYIEDKVLQFHGEQALKLSAIKGEPNLSIHWEVRQIHLKKWPKRHFKFDKSIIGRKAVSAEKPLLPKICFWPTSLIHFWQIWSKKIKNKIIISILSVNVTTFNSNIFWFVRNPICSSLIKFAQICSSLIKFDQVFSNLLKFDQV